MSVIFHWAQRPAAAKYAVVSMNRESTAGCGSWESEAHGTSHCHRKVTCLNPRRKQRVWQTWSPSRCYKEEVAQFERFGTVYESSQQFVFRYLSQIIRNSQIPHTLCIPSKHSRGNVPALQRCHHWEDVFCRQTNFNKTNLVRGVKKVA